MAAEQRTDSDGPPAEAEDPPPPVGILRRAAHVLYDQLCEHWFMVGLGVAIGVGMHFLASGVTAFYIL